MNGRFIETSIDRVRGAYVKMPGMRLTLPQIERLCGIDASACVAVVNALLDLKFLSANGDGTYSRRAPLRRSDRISA